MDDLAVEQGCYYDKTAADHVMTFFTKYLVHSKGQWSGKTFKPLDWQEWDVLRPLFGWKRANGTRRFRRSYISIPKKNGKSTLCAGIALYLLIADKEAGAEVYSAAADADQASIVYKEAANMVESSPMLKARLAVAESRKTIKEPLKRCWYKALSADVPTKDGLNIHGLIFDELHTQPDRKLWDKLKYGGASRRQPLFISITTAGSDRLSLCYDQYTYAKKIISGKVRDTSFYACIYELAENPEKPDAWKDPANWRIANPSFGSALDEDQFTEDFNEAMENPLSENSFKRYRLNQWTQQETRYIPMDKWRLCHGPIPELEDKRIEFFGGLDLASTQDICAYVQFFHKQMYVKCHFFIPEASVQKRIDKDHVPYDLWIKQGFLIATRGNVIDEEHVIETVLKSCEKNKCREIGYDPWNAPHVVTRLADEQIEMVPVRQGFLSLNYPTKEMLKWIVSLKLNHGNNPILDWMANNLAVETDAAANVKPSKKLAREKIDGIAALVNAAQRYLVHHGLKPSVYESRGPVNMSASEKKML
jgi:phage terminase large subunit-like protein